MFLTMNLTIAGIAYVPIVIPGPAVPGGTSQRTAFWQVVDSSRHCKKHRGDVEHICLESRR